MTNDENFLTFISHLKGFLFNICQKCTLCGYSSAISMSLVAISGPPLVGMRKTRDLHGFEACLVSYRCRPRPPRPSVTLIQIASAIRPAPIIVSGDDLDDENVDDDAEYISDDIYVMMMCLRDA